MHESTTPGNDPETETHGEEALPLRPHPKGRQHAPLRPTRENAAASRARSTNGVVAKRITVEAETATGSPASASPGDVGELPAVIRDFEAGRKLVVPSSAELELALQNSSTLEDLISFERMVSVLKKAGEQFRVVREEAIRIATCDINTQRKIGTLLLQVDRRGGDGAKSHADSLLKRLLDELGKNKVKRYRAIARIDEAHFTGYLKLVAEQHEVPTEAGAFRHARRLAAAAKSPRLRKAKKSKIEPATREISPSILDAVQRALGPIDVCIGDAKVKCEVRLKANTAKDTEMRGRVLVSHCVEPGQCLTKLADMKRKGAIDEAIVALPRDIDAQWWSALSAGAWSLCVPTERGSPIVAHIGGHARGFALVFATLGVVADVQHRLGAEARG